LLLTYEEGGDYAD